MTDRRWYSAILGGIDCLILNPIVTLIGIAAIFAEAMEILLSPGVGGLSVLGLATQAFVFAVVALNWPMRMTLPLPEEFHGPKMLSVWFLKSWYELVGWAAVNNAIFAIGQAILFAMAFRRTGDSEVLGSNGETNPLLPH